jgi:hypothetical protein
MQVTIPEHLAVEVERIMASWNLSLDEVVAGAIVLLVAADMEQLYTPDPDDPRPNAAGRPTKFFRIGFPVPLEWKPPMHWPHATGPIEGEAS